MFRKSSRGISFIEFCLSLPILLVFSISIIDTYRGLYSYTIVRSTARFIAEKASKLNEENESVDSTPVTRNYIWYKNTWVNATKTNRIRRRISGTYLEGIVPSNCLNLRYDESCEKVFLSSSGLEQEINYAPNLEEIVMDYGKPELLAGLPSAKFNCTDNPNCTNIDHAIVLEEGSDSKPKIEVTIMHQAPTYFLGLLNKKKFLNIKSTFSKTLESSFHSEKPNSYIGAVGIDK